MVSSMSLSSDVSAFAMISLRSALHSFFLIMKIGPADIKSDTTVLSLYSIGDSPKCTWR